MKVKSLEMSLLFDFYGELLTEKQRETFDLYYNEDLSLSEIAEHENITRQGVRDFIKHAENRLRSIEQKLGLLHRFQTEKACMESFAKEIDTLTAINAVLCNQELSASIQRLSKLLEQFHAGGC